MFRYKIKVAILLLTIVAAVIIIFIVKNIGNEDKSVLPVTKDEMVNLFTKNYGEFDKILKYVEDDKEALGNKASGNLSYHDSDDETIATGREPLTQDDIKIKDDLAFIKEKLKLNSIDVYYSLKMKPTFGYKIQAITFIMFGDSCEQGIVYLKDIKDERYLNKEKIRGDWYYYFKRYPV